MPHPPAVRHTARPFHRRIAPLAGSVAALLLWSASSPAQTYTATGTGFFTNPLNWNLGAGPVPASDAALALTVLTHGSGSVSATNDLNLTLNTLNIAQYGSGSLSLTSFMRGGYAFAGGAARINVLGSGGSGTLSPGSGGAAVVFGQGMTSLTFDGAGPSSFGVNGSIASNTSAGAPLIIATDARNAGTGVVSLTGPNTFAGGVVLNSGTLAIGNGARSLGDRSNVLTINGGNLRGANSSSPIANNVTLASTLNFNSALSSMTLAGALSGPGGVSVRTTDPTIGLTLSGVNGYTGATTIGASTFAVSPADGAGALTIAGAGSILATSGISIGAGASFNLSQAGASVANARVSTGTAISSQGGFVQVLGSLGVVRQSLGTVNAGGLTTIAALVNNASTAVAGAATEVTIADLTRAAGTTVLFQGANLGASAVAPGLAAAQGNVVLSKINGATPTLGLVGGAGAAGSTTVSILPWALGDTSNGLRQINVGSGFVTLEATGARLLNTTTEYNLTNKFDLAGATENMRVTGAITPHAGPAAVNSVYFANTGQTLAGGANALTITSGALASNVAAATISNPLLFGPAGAGEAVVSVADAIGGTANNLTLSGGFTAASLTKSGHGDLTLSAVNPTLTGAITINGGEIKVNATALLGAPSGIAIKGQSQSFSRAGLSFTHNAGTQTLATPIVTTGGAAGITTAVGGTLALNSTISGTGGVNYTAATSSFIQIGGTNDYTGPTFLSGTGTVEIANDAAFGSSADPAGGFLSINNANLRVNGAWTSARHLFFSFASGLNTGANPVTLSGPIVGSSVTVTKTGSGTLTVTGNDSSFSGAIALGSPSAEGGTLAISGNGALNSASVTLGTNLAPAGTYALDLSGAADIDATDGSSTPWRSLIALNTGTGAFTSAHTVQLGSSVGAPVDLRVDSGAFGGTAGVIAGFGKLVKVGGGTLTLNGTTASTFTGGVEVRGGTLAFSADGQLGNAANGIVVDGGILNYTGAGLALSRAIMLGAAPQPLRNGAGGSNTVVTLANGLAGNGPIDFGGTLSGAGGFNKSGNNTLALVGAANGYLGDTQISAGTLAFTNPNQLGASTSRIRLNGGTLSDNAGSGTQTQSRTIFTTANSTVNVAGTATLDLAGPIVGTSTNTITKTSTGGLTISGNNSSFFGVLTVGNGTAAGGNLTLASTGQLRGATVNLLAGAASTFDLSGLTRELAVLGAGATSFATGNTVALGAGGALTTGFNDTTMTWAGSITGDANATVTKVGTGILTLTSNTHTFGGGFHLLSGNAAFSTAGTLPAQSVFTVGGWGTTANAGSRFAIDNSSTNVASRLGDAQIIHSNSGEISYAGFSTLSTETVGSLRGAGMSTITMNSGGVLAFADATNGLMRLDRGTFLFRSQSGLHGTAAASTTVSAITFGNLPGAELIGGSGADGSATISILPYAISGANTTDTGSRFVTYGPNGIRALNVTTEVQANLLTAAATENVRMADAIQTTSSLAADLVVNSLNISSTANTTRIQSAAAQKLTVTSGAVLNNSSSVWAVNAAGTAGVTLGLQTAELQTGAGNTRELNVFTTTGDLALGAKVTTTGGLTKSGAAALYLTNAVNAYSGPTTVNAGSLVIDNKAAFGGSTSLVIGGGFLKYRGGDTTLTGFTVTAAGGAVAGLGASAGFHVVSGTTLTLPAASVSGNGGILKDGTGVLKLTGTNTNSGATIISGGALAIDGPAALGTHSRVIFGTGISVNGGQTLRFDAPMTLPHDFIASSTVNGIGFGFDTNGNDVTLSGTILHTLSSNIRGLYKLGAGELNLTATEMYTGATQVFGGTLRLSGANGSILNSTGTGGFSSGVTAVVVNSGTALVLDNTAANNNNRLPDVWDTPFGTSFDASGGLRVNGGEFKIIGNAAGTSERVNRVEVTLGTFTLQGGGTTVTSGQFARASTPGAGLIRGTNLGGTPGAASTNWFVTDLGLGGVQLGGAGGAKGTPFINILPGFMGDTSATGFGTDLVTYAADTGFRLLTAGEYTATIPAGNLDLHRAPNVALTGAAAVNTNTAITALKLGPGASLGGSGALVIAQSTVLATGNASITVPTLTNGVTGTTTTYNLLTPNAGTTLTVSSVLPGAGLSKYGEGTLRLEGRYTGGAVVNLGQGTLLLGGVGAALNPLQGVTIYTGATLDLGGSDRTIGGLGGTDTIGNTGLGQSAGGTVALGANRLTLHSSSGDLFTGAITGSGGLTKSASSVSTSTFTQPLAYTGSTVIRGGEFRLAGAGTLASTAVEIRRGTLHFSNSDDNAAAGGYIADRLGSSVPITLAGGLTFTENANTPGNHNLGPLTLAGGGTLAITNGASAPSTVTVTNLTRSAARGTLTVTATNLGLAQSPIGNARVFLTQIEGAAPAAALLGGGGAAGSTTQSILPWAALSTGAFLTYGADGLRPLTLGEYEPNEIDSPSAPTVNSAISLSLGLNAPRTLNSLLVIPGGGVSGAFDLTLTSGALATTSSSGTIGVNTNALLTGAGNTRELVANTSGGSATLAYNVTTTGGLTKMGGGQLTVTGTNSFTGGLTIQDGNLAFNNDNQLGAPGGVVRFGSGTLIYTGAAAAPLVFARPVELTGAGSVFGVNGGRWRFNGPITGAGAIGYFTANAIFEINAVNSYTGATTWSNGQLYIDGDSAFGNGGELLMQPSVGFQNIVLRGPWTTSRLIQAGSSNPGLQTNGFDATWSGQFLGVASPQFAKNGTGALILTEAMAYNGILTVNAGEVRLRDRGSLAAGASTRTVNPGAALTLDDTGVHFPDRLADTGSPIALAGGELKLLGHSAVTTEEVIADLSLAANSASTVTVAAGAGQAAIVRIAGTLTATGGGSLWRGTNLGVNAPGAANSATVILAETTSQQQGGLANLGFLVGGGALAGNPNVSVIRGGFGDLSATGTGTQLVTYDFDKGIRLLNPATEYTTTLINGSVVADNVKADASSLAFANATTANALWLKDGASVTGAGTLTLTAGSLLVTGTGNTIANPLTAGANALAVGGPGDVALNGAISGTGGGLIKMGSGTLTLAVANSYSGANVLAAGTVAVGDAAAFGVGLLRLQGGAIRNASAGPLTLTNQLVLAGPMLVSGTQDLNFNGTVSLASATREINVTNTATTTLSGLISSSTAQVNYGLTKTGPGLLVLSNPINTYDGETIVAGGELRISGSIAGSTQTTVQTGTLSGTGTVGNVNVLAGATLHGGDSTAAAGALTSAGNISLADNSIIRLTLGTSSTHSSLARTGGTWAFDSDQAFSFAFLGGGVATYDNVITGLLGSEAGLASVGTWQITNPGITGTFSYDGIGGVDLAIASIPEPGAMSLLGGALGLLGFARRRR